MLGGNEAAPLTGKRLLTLWIPRRLCCRNADIPGFADAFFFSMETVATVGYAKRDQGVRFATDSSVEGAGFEPSRSRSHET